MTLMDQSPRTPTSYADLRTETYEEHAEPWQWNWQPGTERTVMSVDEETGGSTYLVRFPPGYERPDYRKRPADQAEKFEWHSCHEEIFCLEGHIRFGDWYVLPEMGYLNHPPRWVHPADQYSEEGCLLLIKNSAPCDFVYCDIPASWNGQEYLDGRDPAQPLGADEPPGVTTLALNDLPWRSLRNSAGEDTGVQARHLYHHPTTGWTTWMARIPAGWSGQQFARPAGAESVFVVEGEVDLAGRSIEKWGYGSVKGSLLTAPQATSRRGATLICWTRSLNDVGQLD